MFEHNEDLFLTRAEFDAGVFGRANPPSFPAGPQVAVTKAISVTWLCRLRVTCIQVCELGEGKSVSHAMERFRRQVWTCHNHFLFQFMARMGLTLLRED